MNVQIAEWTLINAQNSFSITNLCEISGLSEREINLFIENNILTPIDSNALVKIFPIHSIAIVSGARRLRDDFELDSHGMMLALTLMQRIDDMQSELKLLRAQFKQT
ncbi:chaperone modulator CbpM [Undibacterium sp. SXout7W]|uniref:chaperone modulator CbpM n=1 Tax=Undibacterium sp. SXout7W TaxID=3413049 RepID=UPI003BF3153E